MSRTQRNSPKDNKGFFSNTRYSYELTHLDNIWGRWVYQSVAKGGWKEAKRLLSKSEYNELRRRQGDCNSKFIKCFTVPTHYRKQTERTYRKLCNKEVKQFLHNDEYEVIIHPVQIATGWNWY